MSDTSPNYFRGILVPHKFDKDNIWTAQASFTQSDNLAGDPEPQQNSRLVLRATGPQLVDTDLQIISRKAGHAERGGAFTWKNNKLVSPDEFGQNSKNAITGFEFLAFSSGVTEYLNPYTLNLGDGNLLVVLQEKDVSGNRKIRCYKRDTEGTTTSVVIKNYGPSIVTSLTQASHPILVKKANGDILCIFGEEDKEQELYQLVTYRSQDNGVTFSAISRTACATPIGLNASTGYQIKRIRGASLGGQILLFIETIFNDASAPIRNRLYQFASIDGGGQFLLVTTANRLDDYAFYQVDCFTRNNEFILTYIAATGAAHYMIIPQAFMSAHILRNGNAYVTITSETVAGGSSGHMTSGQMAAMCDDNGGIYCIFEAVSAGEALWMRYSEDGINWRYMNGDSSVGLSTIYDVRDSGTIPKNIHISTYAGQAVLACNFDTTTSSDNSAGLIFLGGFGNINLPIQISGYGEYLWNRAGYEWTYLPFDLPANISTITITGSSTQALTSTGLQIQSTIATIGYTVSVPTAISTSNPVKITGRCHLIGVTKGSTAAPFVDGLREIKLEISNTVTSYEVSIRIGLTSFIVWDVNAAAQVGGSNSIDATTGIEILYSIKDNTFACWYRQALTSNSKSWIAGPTSTSLSNGGAASAAAKMSFHHSAVPSAGTLETKIVEFVGGYATDAPTPGTPDGAAGQGLASGFTNPDDLMTAAYPTSGFYKYVSDNVRITTASGPAYEGDEYRIRTRYQYPIENVFFTHAPSPRLFWKSVAVTSGSVPEQFIPLAMDSSSQTANQLFGNDLIGLHLAGINFRTFNIEYYDIGSGGWTNLKTVNTQIGLEFNFNAKNKTIEGIDGSDEPYVFMNEFAGSLIELSIGGAVEYHKIISHSAGKCSTTAYKRPIFELDGKPTGNGIAKIIPKDITIIINLNGVEATAWAIRIPTGVSYDNARKIGQLLLGPIVVAGKNYSYGRTISLEQNIDIYETPDNIVYARKISPPRRRARIAWTEGVDISKLMGLNPTPDVWSSSTTAGAEKIATENDVPYLIFGLMDYLQGGVNPCVYLPSIPRSVATGTDIQIINRYHHHIMSTLDPEASIENVIGEETLSDGGEVFRVSTIQFIEVV